MVLWVATTNAGKLRDFAQALTPGVRLEALPGVREMAPPAETAETFEGNARIKAEAYSRMAPGRLVLADDSGLEVDALGGRPGVRSARFAEDVGFGAGDGVDGRNNECLLAAMRGVPAGLRGGRYRCVLAVARDGVTVGTAEGCVEGEILTAGRGMGGFGYDPLFLLPAEGLTMAEVDGVTRMRYSHRARALGTLLRQVWTDGSRAR